MITLIVAIVALVVSFFLPTIWPSKKWSVRIARIMLSAGIGYAAGLFITWLGASS